MKSRTTLILSLLAVPFLLIIAIMLSVPYYTDTTYINRRTARMTMTTAYFMIPIEHERSRFRTVLEELGLPLTAPDIDVECRIRIFRFPWSSSVDVNPPEGRGLQQDYNFYFLIPYANRHEILPDQFDALMRKRVALWNSPDLEKAGLKQRKRDLG